MRSSITLGEAAAERKMLYVACSRCPRRGRLSFARLIAQHGPHQTTHAVTANLTADCPHREDSQIGQRCDLYFPREDPGGY